METLVNLTLQCTGLQVTGSRYTNHRVSEPARPGQVAGISSSMSPPATPECPDFAPAWLQRRFQLERVDSPLPVASGAVPVWHETLLARMRRCAYAHRQSVVPLFCMESANTVALGSVISGLEPGRCRLRRKKEVRA